MKVTLKQLLAIRELARTQSFTQAAARLHTTQSNLSLAIQEIEGVLGAKLFHRSTKQCRLSPVGEEFLPVVVRVLDDLHLGIESVQSNVQLQRGMLSVGTSALLASDVVACMLADYGKKFPHVQLRLEDQATADHIKLLRGGQVELVIGMYSELDADLVQYPLFEGPLVVFAHRSLALPPRLKWRQLEQQRMVSITRTSSVGRLIEKTWWHVHRRDYTPDMQCHHWGSVLALAEAAQTLCIAPLHAVREGAHPELERIELEDPVVTRTISLAHLRHHELSPAARAFVEMVLPPDSSDRALVTQASDRLG